ncbi:DUF262 domain-containing HNH endonuclease family protein [Aliarcobacter skirrowii]|uniref:DUF262 domain-containing protein n=1 Tax=Aliarcobacter skirrowii TaxID=28200 RepID=UPI0029ABF4B8|nr:DUF262 domain-containing HNH endonuclease family protein [Aliarcobacter skirrowii]MDX4049004.1 DUF262 domain-containing HNH endonuclease family protein [Aliarcobacter skirrowii]
MEARQISIEDFLSSNKTRFIIPVYQRNYDWREKNCLQLFDDIKEASKRENIKSHFMGSIVYVSNSETESIDLKEYVIIDGQQRLTTITLFLKALYDVILDENLKEEIYETYLINKRLDEQNKIKLKPIKKDDESFRKLLKNDFDTIDKNSNIYKNYIFFKEKLLEIDNTIELFKGFKKLFIVHIALNRRDDNPQLIFESINSTGVSLSQSDLIRNFLLMDKEAEEQTKLFENYWFKIEENLSSENISDFVRDYLTMKQNKIPNKSEVYEAFKKFVYENKFDVKELLDELYEYSKIYKTFLNPKNEVYALKIQNLKFLKVTVVFPFLIVLVDLYNKKKIDEENLLHSLNIIESYIVRRAICNQATNALNKVFAGLYNELLEIDIYEEKDIAKYINAVLVSKKGTAIFPNNDMFKVDFTSRDMYNIKNKQFFLGVLENNNNKEKVDFFNLSVEHYMPQTLTNSWKVHLGDKFQSIHNMYVHNIGNLSLTAHNSELGNKSFEEKKQFLKEQSRLKLNSFFVNSTSWGENEIKQRANQLFEEAKELWKYEDISMDILVNNEDKEFYTLDDNIDITNKKPIAFEIDKTKYSVKSWKEILVKVLEVFIDIDINAVQRFTKDSDFQGIKRRIISDREEDIRQAEKIADNIFVETNLSANSTLANIKLICEKFGLENDDFIFYVK